MQKLLSKLFITLILLVIFSSNSFSAVRFITDGYADEPYQSERHETVSCEKNGMKASTPIGYRCEKVHFEGKACYKNCEKLEVIENCRDAGYLSVIPDRNSCDQVSLGDKTCYKNCTSTCKKNGYMDVVEEGKKCEPVTVSGTNCYKNCKTMTCEDIGFTSNKKPERHCYEIQYMSQKCYNCLRYEEICSNGGYLHYVPVGQACDEVEYLEAKCYANCRNFKCSDIGYYDGNQQNMKCNRVILGEEYNNCYECRNYRCTDGGYSSYLPIGKDCKKIDYFGTECFDLNNCK